MTFLWGVGWQKFFSPEFVSLARPRRTLQNPKKVFVRVKFVFLRRFNQTVDHAAGLCAARRIGKQPVLPAHHKGLDAALGTVVAQLQTAILQVGTLHLKLQRVCVSACIQIAAIKPVQRYNCDRQFSEAVVCS